MTAPLIHSACFRRWAGPMTRDEARLIESLERRRHQTDSVRALIADPQRRFSRILCLYLAWLQMRITPLSCAIIALRDRRNAPRLNLTRLRRFSNPSLSIRTPKNLSSLHSSSPLHAIPRALFFTGRTPYATHGMTYEQVLILDADLISPSRPYWNSTLEKIISSTVMGLSMGSGSVCIIVGNPERRRRNHFRRHWLRAAQAASPGARVPSGAASPRWLLLNPQEAAPVESLPRPVECRGVHAADPPPPAPQKCCPLHLQRPKSPSLIFPLSVLL